MNYIITGGFGFIGKNLTIALDRLDEDFLVLDMANGCDVCSADIREKECKNFIHLAAETNIRESIESPSKTISLNILSTINCLNYAMETGAHFIFTSSMGAPQALSPYSASKLACEAICNAYRETYDVKITILRLSSVYGYHSIHKQSVIHSFIKSALNKETLTIFGSGLQTRDFVHVDDVINTILTCKDEKLINVGSGISTPILEIAHKIRDLSSLYTNFSPPIEHFGPIKGEILNCKPLSDIKSLIYLEDGLERTFQWYLEHYETKQLG